MVSSFHRSQNEEDGSYQKSRATLYGRTRMKPWYKSKTVWFNILCTLAPIADYLASSTGLMQSFMTPTRFALYTSAVGLLNILLRTITTHGVSFFKEQDAK